MFKVGFAYDSHKFSLDRKLIIGGVVIPSKKGLMGHSDADVLTHALMDALLGALAEGDIGKHFPDDDPQYKNISSLELLTEVKKEVERKKYVINTGVLTFGLPLGIINFRVFNESFMFEYVRLTIWLTIGVFFGVVLW